MFANYYGSIFSEKIEVENENILIESIQNNLEQNIQEYNKIFTMKELNLVLKNLPKN